jgi:hypothetical protein
MDRDLMDRVRIFDMESRKDRSWALLNNIDRSELPAAIVYGGKHRLGSASGGSITDAWIKKWVQSIEIRLIDNSGNLIEESVVNEDSCFDREWIKRWK